MKQAERIDLSPPTVDEGGQLWRIASESGELDVNSPYAYLLWARDFARTSVAARSGDRVVGFVTGYLRAGAADTLFVWQVAVDPAFRGRGVAGRMLAQAVAQGRALGARYLETTITPGNTASVRLFAGLARDQGVDLTRSTLFAADQFPDDHDPEQLHRLGPWPA